jgi:DNA-binding NarL/FixJ family response regulator
MLPEDLTDKELKVINLICKGYSNNEIAKELGNHPGYIKNIVSNVYSLLGVHSARKLIYEVYKTGLIHPPVVSNNQI